MEVGTQWAAEMLVTTSLLTEAFVPEHCISSRQAGFLMQFASNPES